jgi:hypothetical protein
MYGGVEVSLQHYMEVSGQRLTPAAIPPGMDSIGGWVCPRTGLDVMEKRINCFLCQESNLGRPARRYNLLLITNIKYKVDYTIMNMSIYVCCGWAVYLTTLSVSEIYRVDLWDDE